jgi:hypothetical protein
VENVVKSPHQCRLARAVARLAGQRAAAVRVLAPLPRRAFVAVARCAMAAMASPGIAPTRAATIIVDTPQDGFYGGVCSLRKRAPSWHTDPHVICGALVLFARAAVLTR